MGPSMNVPCEEIITGRGRNTLRIKQGGYETLYTHCSQIAVTEGQEVFQGQVIAFVGSTGNSTGPHLHFELRKDGARQNPLGYYTPRRIT